MKPQISQIVTTNESVEAYYSREVMVKPYAPNPYVAFEPGDIGYVAEINVPCVSHTPGNPYTFNCVDFWKYGRKWRVALWTKQIAKPYATLPK